MVGRFVLAIVALAALLVMGAGAAVAGFVGSDDTVFNRPTELGEDGRPILTAPDLLAYDGITVTLRASAPGGVFIGTAHPVDVADFVGDSSRIRLTNVTRTGVTSEDVGSKPPVQPAEADFWTSLDERRRRRGAHPQPRQLGRPVGDRAAVRRRTDDGVVRGHGRTGSTGWR